jgi:hypothetical protein
LAMMELKKKQEFKFSIWAKKQSPP